MQNYPVRASHRGNLTAEALERILREHFGSASVSGGSATTSFGAIARLAVQPAGRDLCVDVTMDPKVAEEVARETIARYNRFLEAATGYSAKERAKRLRKAATVPGAGA